MAGSFLWAALILAPEATAAIDPDARLTPDRRQECRRSDAAKGNGDVLVCGRRDNPYRISKEIMATLPPDPLAQRKIDSGQAALASKSCPRGGPFACDLTGSVQVPILPVLIKTLQVLTGTPVREVLRTSPDQYDVYQDAKGGK